MSRGFKVIQDLSKKLSPRTVQVTVVPTPLKFSERRAVLHALQRLAKIEVFRKQENHESSFISVTSDASSADELVKKSPLQYEVDGRRAGGSTGAVLTNETRSELDTQSNAGLRGKESSASAMGDDGLPNKQFTLHIFPAPDYIHSAAIRASPLHGPWPDGRRETTMFSVLKASLPNDILSDGLSDWESGGQNSDMASGKMVEGLLFGQISTDPSKRLRAERLHLKEKKNNMPAAMDGLLHLSQQEEAQASKSQGAGEAPTT